MVKMHIHQLYTHAASYILSSLSCISVKEFYKNVAVFDVIFSLQKILAGRVMKAQVHHPIYTQQKSEVKIAIVGLPFRVLLNYSKTLTKNHQGIICRKLRSKPLNFQHSQKKQLGGVYNNNLPFLAAYFDFLHSKTRCLKITQMSHLNFSLFGIFHQFLSFQK